MSERDSRWPVIAAFALVGAATQVLWLTFAPVTTVAAVHYGVSENAIGWLAKDRRRSLEKSRTDDR